MSETKLPAATRDPRASTGRRLRREGWVPGVYYTAGGDTRYLKFQRSTLQNLLKKEVALIEVEVDGEKLPCILREVQREPVREEIMHIDLYGVAREKKIKARVPVHPVGIAAGIKEGGTLEILLRELEIECLPGDIPLHLDVEVAGLNINDLIRLGDLSFPGLTLHGDAATTVVHVIPPRQVAVETPAAEAVAAPTPEVEVIRERKPTEEQS